MMEKPEDIIAMKAELALVRIELAQALMGLAELAALKEFSGLALIKWRAISGLCDGLGSYVLELDWAFVA